MDVESSEDLNDTATSRAGSASSGAGMRDDVIDLFEELEEARNTLTQIREIMQQASTPSRDVGGRHILNGSSHKGELFLLSMASNESFVRPSVNVTCDPTCALFCTVNHRSVPLFFSHFSSRAHVRGREARGQRAAPLEPQ